MALSCPRTTTHAPSSPKCWSTAINPPSFANASPWKTSGKANRSQPGSNEFRLDWREEAHSEGDAHLHAAGFDRSTADKHRYARTTEHNSPSPSGEGRGEGKRDSRIALSADVFLSDPQ